MKRILFAFFLLFQIVYFENFAHILKMCIQLCDVISAWAPRGRENSTLTFWDEVGFPKCLNYSDASSFVTVVAWVCSCSPTLPPPNR